MQLFTSSNLAKKLPLNIASNGKWYQALLWLLGYVVIELAQYTFATFPFSQNYLQLGTGYLFAVLLLLPGNIKIIFGIASYSLGVLLSINFGHHNALATGVAYSIIFVQMLTGVWAIHRIKNFNINRPKHAVQFMALGFFLPAVASSIVHAIFVSAQTLQDVINCIAFSIAPAISILIVVPLFFATVTSKLSDRVQQVWLKALWFCVLVALTVGIFGILNNEGPDLPRYSVFLFPLIMYSSYQYSFRFNTLVMLILFTIATWLDGYSGHVSLYNGQQSFVMVAVYFDIAQSIMLLIGAFRSKNEWNDQSIAKKNDALELADAVFKSTSNAIVISDIHGVILSVNEGFTAISGYESEEVIGAKTSLLHSGMHDAAFYKNFWDEMAAKGKWHGEFCHRRKDGTLYYELKTVSLVHEVEGDTSCYVSIGIDITEEKQLRDEFAYVTTHDVITGLINRSSFEAHAVNVLRNQGIGTDSSAILLLDLDNFKNINDAYGHHFGDRILGLVAKRLTDNLAEGTVVARFGGDEFAILVPQCNKARAIQVAEDILIHFSEPAEIDNLVIDVGLSIGVALSSSLVKDLDTLIANASHEVRTFKQQGKSIYNFFREKPRDESTRVIWIQNELRKGLHNGDLSLFYQPQKSLVTHRSVGWEALIRWNHPEVGQISPGVFIPIAEQSGYIRTIDDWVLNTACKQIVSWIEHDLPLRRVAINISYSTFVRPQFYRELTEMVAGYRIEPRWIELEITERMLIHTDNHVLDTMNALVALGFSISIDDFGTGYSNLAYISKFPVNKIKIDMSFVRGIESNEKNQNIVKAIIDLSHGLKLTAIAEGVETAAESEFLATLGCDEMQGFWYHRPINSLDSGRLLTDEFRNLKI